MPVMNEGTPVITVRKHPTISVDIAAKTDLRIQREIMSRVPEVIGVMARPAPTNSGLTCRPERNGHVSHAGADKGLARRKASTGSLAKCAPC